MANAKIQIGSELIKLLRSKFGVKNNHNLAKQIGCTSVTLNSWEKKGISARGISWLIHDLCKKEYINGFYLIEELIKGFGVKNKNQLSKKLGIAYPTIDKYSKQRLTSKKIFDILRKSAASNSRMSIKPIIEFYPLGRELSKSGKYYDVLDCGKERNAKIKEVVESLRGVYIFYNSQGDAIYVGKAVKQNLWKEIRSAFNRTREAQTIYRTNYPTTGKTFQELYKEKNRKIRKHNLKLHDLAAYISVYEVEKSLISHLEAALIRIFPNQIMNSRVEAFKKLN